ncbi:hypothetical protein FBU31_005629 [Coemansia sp. 'formosensis']|nr:hypothetical protein FBU31_005629 [Coemansia sp. 'formosensis']
MALFKLGSLLSKAASPPQPQQQQPPPPPPSYTPNVRPLAGYTVRGRAVESMNVGGFLTMGRKDSSPASLPCIPRLASAPAVPRVPAFSSTDNTRTYSTPPPPQPPVFGASVGTRTQSTMIVKPVFSLPDNSRNHSTPIVAHAFSSSPAAADNTQTPSSSPPIVSSPPPLSSPDNSRALNIVASSPPVGSPPNNTRTHSSTPPIVSPIVAPAGQSDTDDDSGIAASVTKLTKPSESAEDPTPAESTDSAPAATSHLSPRLSLRLSVDGAALGLSAFVAPLPPSPEEEEEEKEEKASDDDDDDPVRARLHTLRTRRLANPSEASDGGRRFRATQSAKGKGGGGGGKPLAKMGNLQLDRLTKLNTRRNSTYMACRIERFTVVREGDRPPSPSSAMLARARERKKLNNDDDEDDEVSLLNDDSSDDDDMRPITPVSDVSMDVKRKSVELAADDDARLVYGVLKKQCRVHWGSRSILRATWAAEGAVSAPKPILVNKEAVDAKAEGPSPDLCVVRVACIEYPAHVSSEDDGEEELAMDDDEEEEEEEYVPRRSGRRKKVV